MATLLRWHNRGCFFRIQVLLWLAVAVDEHRRWVAGRVKRWERRVRRVYDAWVDARGTKKPPRFARRRFRPHNRTPDEIEIQVVRLHVEHPALGAGQLGRAAERVLAASPWRARRFGR
ncbi:MAG: hypothetical protein R3B72_07405 [Polyangiaceae bacterium]